MALHQTTVEVGAGQGDRTVWTSDIMSPMSDRYQFQSLLSDGERVKIWIGDQLGHTSSIAASVDDPIDLELEQRYRIRIESRHPGGPFQLQLFWSSRTLDLSPIPRAVLFPDAR